MRGVILIVEDSEPCATTLEMVLDKFPGCRTRTARNANEALRFLAPDGPSEDASIRAVITDLQLPSIDGFDLIERIRSHPLYASTPILVTSGDTSPDNTERLRRLGVDAYFVKPYSPAAVRRTLEQLLRCDSPASSS